MPPKQEKYSKQLQIQPYKYAVSNKFLRTKDLFA